MSAPARTSITVARSNDTQAILIVADAESAETDFLAGQDRYVALQGLNSTAVRAVAQVVELALGRRSTRLTIGNQTVEIGCGKTSIFFRQDGRECIVSRSDAEEVVRRCDSVANHIDLKRL